MFKTKDYVIVFKKKLILSSLNNDEILDEKDRYRFAFLDNLTKNGVEVEIVSIKLLLFINLFDFKNLFYMQDSVKIENNLFKFVRLHLPWQTVIEYAEKLNFYVPIQVGVL